MTYATRHQIHRLALARSISIAGGEAAYLGLVALTYARTHSPLWVSATLIALIGTAGVVSPFAGMLGDRFERRLVMIGSDVLSACAFVALAFADSPIAIVMLAAVAALVEAPFLPAATAAIPNLVCDDDLVWANTLVGRGRNIGFLIGPLSGGLMVAAFGPHIAFIANAATFLVSAGLVVSIRFSFGGARSDAALHGGMGEGFRLVFADRVLRAITLAWFLFLLGVGFVLVAELPLAHYFHQGSVGYGLLIAAWAAGAVAGSFVAARVIRRGGEQFSLVAGAAVAACGIGLVGVAPSFVLALCMLAVGGAGNAVTNVAEETLVQRRAPDRVRSRVVAAQEFIVVCALAVSFAGGGLALSLLGPQRVYLLAGAGGIVGTSILVAMLDWAPARSAVTSDVIEKPAEP